MDKLADKDFSHYMTQEEYFRYRQNWWISLNKSGDTGGSLRNRSDFTEALSTLNRVDHSGPCHSGSTRNSTNHRVLPPVGGNGVVFGGAHNNSKKSMKEDA